MIKSKDLFQKRENNNFFDKFTKDYVDLNPYNNLSYYRLKQTDFNGNFEYSPIVSISYTNVEINAFPNPIKNVLNLANLDPTDIVKIFTINGQIIYQGNMNRINTTNWKNSMQ